jgi:hypothetical protein
LHGKHVEEEKGGPEMIDTDTHYRIQTFATCMIRVDNDSGNWKKLIRQNFARSETRALKLSLPRDTEILKACFPWSFNM